jgi:hypothetical protein
MRTSSACSARLTAGDILVSNFHDKANVQGTGTTLVEITPAGKQLATKTLIKNGAGDLFGIITTPTGLIVANNGTNALDQINM